MYILQSTAVQVTGFETGVDSVRLIINNKGYHFTFTSVHKKKKQKKKQFISVKSAFQQPEPSVFPQSKSIT